MTTDYISRGAALACFHDWIDRYGHEHSADEITEYQRIEDLPAADVVEVVRCGECRYSEIDNGILCCDTYNAWNIDPNGFCSFAERRPR